jgi:RNA polymerase sigma-70 factor (ECF subfamily)
MSTWVESRRAGRPDQAAFAALYQRHRRGTGGRVATVLGRHAAHADDVFQETWLEVASTDAWQPRSFRAWVNTIATRKALDRIARSDVKHADHPAADDEGDVLDRFTADGPAPDQRAHARGLARIVVDIVARLPAEQRDAWTLRYVEGAQFQEIAAQQQVPLGTAKTRVRIAAEALAAALARRGLSAQEGA